MLAVSLIYILFVFVLQLLYYFPFFNAKATEIPTMVEIATTTDTPELMVVMLTVDDDQHTEDTADTKHLREPSDETAKKP